MRTHLLTANARTRVCVILLALAASIVPHTAAAQWRTSVLPVLGSAPETGGQFGVAVFRTRQPEDTLGTRPSSLMGNAVFTTENQQRAFVEYDRWTAGNERRTQASVVLSRFPLPFWGVGDETLEEPLRFEPITLELGITRQKKIGGATWRSAGLRAVSVDVPTLVYGDLCDIIGQPCLPEPALDFGVPFLGYPHRLVTGTFGIVHDSRDGLFAPTEGKMLDASLGISQVFSEYVPGNILRVRIDARGYRSLAGGGVLAAQAVLQGNDGEVPIDQMALVGHHTLNRGYTMGRYRDHWMAATQLEWRSSTFGWRNRLGVAAFAGAAVIGSEIGTLAQGRVLPSGGGGLRFRLDPRTRSTIRVDYAVGAAGQKGLYVAFNEAF